MAMTARNFRTSNNIMPYMIDSGGGGENILTNDLLFDLCNKKTYNKLANFLSFASCTETAVECTPIEMQCQLARRYDNVPNNIIAVALLAACGPTLEVKLGGNSLQGEELFALQTVTSEYQQQYLDWLASQWHDIDKRPTKTAVMPSFGTDKWWAFMSWFMKAEFDFGVKKKKKKKVVGKQNGVTHQLVTNGFWKTHKIDAIQVGLAHRLRVETQTQKLLSIHFDVPFIREGRPYGVLPQQKRKCFQCPASRPETKCVRQNGKWLCSHSDSTLGATSKCHRDYHRQIDTGYLDIEIPNDKRDGAMVIEEVVQEEEEKFQNVNDSMDKLPAAHR
jgi:hypothetical protein